MIRAAVAGIVVTVLGIAGLVRAEVPSGSVAAPPAIQVIDAWVRQPVPPSTTAAAYFTVRNSGSAPDRLLSVASPLGTATVLHAVVNGQMTATANGVVIPAHASFRLSVGSGHAMIEGLRQPLDKGATVPLVLTFQRFGTVSVSARVVGYLDPVPTPTG